jgi:CHAT domain-containing protein
MLDDQHDTEFRHPKYWAPFFNVGEGGRMD